MTDHFIKNTKQVRLHLLHIFKKSFTAFLFASLALVFGCSEKEQAMTRPEVPVKTAVAVQKDVPIELFANGVVEAHQVVNIKSRVDGQVMQIHIKEGQEVTKGQLIISIDDRPYRAMLEGARSNLTRDRIKWEKAKKDAVRYVDLLQKDYVTKSQAEQAQADAEALEAVVKGDEAALENAKLNVSYCSILAPISGRIGDILIDVGNIVRTGDANPMMVIHQVQPVYVRFPVPESRLPEIQAQMRRHDLSVLATPPGKQSDAKDGKLTFLDNTIDRVTGTIDLKAVFDNPDKSLWPGQFVDVFLILESQPLAVVVPSSAIQMGQEGYYAFVVKSDFTVESRQITVGIQTDGETVVEKGVAPGETVVTDGQLMLRSGVKVAVKNTADSMGDAPK